MKADAKRLLVKASYVATLDDALGTLARGAILVEGDTITAVGPYDRLSRQGPFEEEVGSLEDDLLMPGLVSAHHHTGRMLQDGIPDQPLERWLPFRLGPYAQGFSTEEIYLNTAWSCIELIRGGCTATVDFHTGVPGAERLGVPAAARAYRTIGMRVGLCVGVTDQNRLFYEGNEEVLNRLSAEAKEAVKGAVLPLDLNRFFGLWESLFQELHEPGGRVRIFIGPAAPHTASEELLRRIRDSARGRQTGVQIHMDESGYQRISGLRGKGKSNVKWLDELGFWGPDVSCAHGVWLSKEDLAILRDRGVTVVHNPASNLRLSSGIAPVRVMRELGVPLAFGTDGDSMNDDNDLLVDLRLAHLLQRVPGISVPPISAEEWFKTAVRGGGRVLLQSDSLGSLSPGKKADFILVDLRRLRRPSVSPDVDPLSLLLQRGLGRDVRTLFVGGQALMRDGKILTVDEEAVAEGLKKAMERHYPRLQKARPIFRQVEEAVSSLLGEWDLQLPTKARYQYNIH